MLSTEKIVLTLIFETSLLSIAEYVAIVQRGKKLILYPLAEPCISLCERVGVPVQNGRSDRIINKNRATFVHPVEGETEFYITVHL